MFEPKRNENEHDVNRSRSVGMQNPLDPALQGKSAYIHNNPDFDPAKDVPQARGCFSTFDIISNT